MNHNQHDPVALGNNRTPTDRKRKRADRKRAAFYGNSESVPGEGGDASSPSLPPSSLFPSLFPFFWSDIGGQLRLAKRFNSSHSDLAASSGETRNCRILSGSCPAPPPPPSSSLPGVAVEHANTQTGCEVRGHRGRQDERHQSEGGTNVGTLNPRPTKVLEKCANVKNMPASDWSVTMKAG